MIFLFDDKSEPADIFADIPSEKATAATDALPPRPAGTTPSAVGESGVIMERGPFGKKFAIILVIVLLLAGGGAAAYFLTRGKSASVPAPTAQPIETVPTAPEPQPVPEAPAVQPPETSSTSTAVLDTDGDGLNDAQEAQLGTDPTKVDTDADGLTDREEVEVYKTNPTVSDTDGDSFNDGDEVKNGYNPNGAGKLLQLPPVTP